MGPSSSRSTIAVQSRKLLSEVIRFTVASDSEHDGCTDVSNGAGCSLGFGAGQASSTLTELLAGFLTFMIMHSSCKELNVCVRKVVQMWWSISSGMGMNRPKFRFFVAFFRWSEIEVWDYHACNWANDLLLLFLTICH
ncbi:uncharacterized protein LOC119350174 [Triticum dicoccoides]|uniref:uncharacterized protein LOC119350174 n=1 Tax=Triticum dicoccoides TaxID=85692 RepID=UPI00188EB71A|nr:uncharacterized protein LOC119350174 [Triticum dicoccoides]